MTAKDLAEMISGREYGMELTFGEAKDAKNAGLVVVYGRSDDGVEFQGAIIDEAEAYGGTTTHITPDGLLEDPACGIAENIECPYFAAAKSAAKIIKAVWHDEGGPRWTFETDIPHETFTIVEDGEPWGTSIVFSMEHLRSNAHG